MFKLMNIKLAAEKLTIISGFTTELGVPKSKQVRVYSRASGALITSLKSKTDGHYKVYLPIDVAYTIVAIDSNKLFNAVVQDNVVPK